MCIDISKSVESMTVGHNINNNNNNNNNNNTG